MSTIWQVDSWQQYHAEQQPHYRDQAQLDTALHQLKQLPALLSLTEIFHLRQQLREVFTGQSFILLGGDCAERFHDCHAERVNIRLQVIQQMAQRIRAHHDTTLLTIARLAGQYAKPRTQEFETIDGQRMHAFRGDNINSFTPDPAQREPDPQRLIRGYHCAAATLRHVSALWPATHGKLFTAHEGLLLPYEQALTQKHDTHWYNHGAHLLWLGNRTAHAKHAHVEYLRGIANAIGIKIGHHADPQEMVDIVRTLNPTNADDRIVLIARFGHNKVQELLPRFIAAMHNAHLKVIWTVDPMHGNTFLTADGVKTRDFQHIASEVQHSFALHRTHGSKLSGVHLELSGDDVSECLGGQAKIRIKDLSRNYQTACDPRLNYQQSLELATLIGELL